MGATASATDVRFASASYSITGSTAVLSMTTLDNYATGGNSGTLRMELWAMTSAYSGQGTVSGYKLAQYSVGQLAGGHGYSSISSGSVPFTTPPNGTYYITMFLTEYTNSSSLNNGYVFVKYLTFDKTLTYGTPTQSTTGASFGFSTAVSVGGGYYYDVNLGYMYSFGSGFIYDYTSNQYFYAFPGYDYTTGIYIYDYNHSAWTYTAKSFWPYVYFFNSVGWQSGGFY